MAEIWRNTDWRLPAAVGPAYERLVGAIGSAEFGATVRHCVETLTSDSLCSRVQPTMKLPPTARPNPHEHRYRSGTLRRPPTEPER